MWANFLTNLTLLQNSVSVVWQNGYFFSLLLLTQCAFAVLIARVLDKQPIYQESLSILSFLGGILFTTLFFSLLILFKVKPSPTIGNGTVLAVLFILVWYRNDLQKTFLPGMRWIFVFFGFILLVRLIFVQDLIVPPYSDSIQHTMIVQDFLHPDQPPAAFFQLTLDWRHYYHTGFHALAAWLSGATSISPEKSILLLGQYFQALAILAAYPLAYTLTGDRLTAWAVMIVPGLILAIPAYASNWGKFPAISSLIGMSFVLTLILMFFQNKFVVSREILWTVCIGTLATVILHSRSIFVFLLALLFIFLCEKFKHLINTIATYDETKMLVILVWMPLFYFFIHGIDLPPSSSLQSLEFVFCGLCIFAFYANFRLAWMIVSFILTMGILIYPIQLPFLSARYTLFFDRPFVIIFFYLPASFIIWMGVQEVVRLLFQNAFVPWRHWLFAMMLVTGLTYSLFLQNHQPSPCCTFIKDDDLFSFHWMKESLPRNSLVGIAAIGAPENLQPVDGGEWIEWFTSIPTQKIRLPDAISAKTQGEEINYVEERADLCKDGITHFYVDEFEDSFDEYVLVEVGAKYQFGLGNVRIYSLDCNAQ